MSQGTHVSIHNTVRHLCTETKTNIIRDGAHTLTHTCSNWNLDLNADSEVLLKFGITRLVGPETTSLSRWKKRKKKAAE